MTDKPGGICRKKFQEAAAMEIDWFDRHLQGASKQTCELHSIGNLEPKRVPELSR